MQHQTWNSVFKTQRYWLHIWEDREYDGNNIESKKKRETCEIILEIQFVFLYSKKQLQMNEINIDYSNPVFEVTYQNSSD